MFYNFVHQNKVPKSQEQNMKKNRFAVDPDEYSKVVPLPKLVFRHQKLWRNCSTMLIAHRKFQTAKDTFVTKTHLCFDSTYMIYQISFEYVILAQKQKKETYQDPGMKWFYRRSFWLLLSLCSLIPFNSSDLVLLTFTSYISIVSMKRKKIDV